MENIIDDDYELLTEESYSSAVIDDMEQQFLYDVCGIYSEEYLEEGEN